jgi:DNA-binding CsgD family transcriptional regulator
MEQGLAVARGSLAEVMLGYFQSWSLSPAERDVAAFTIKGYSIAEIAKLRGSAEATIKAQLNAIYRKADVQGRTQLISVLVEDLFREPLAGVDRVKS